jgi:hypothetical protein
MYDRTSLLPTLLTLCALVAFAPAAAEAQVDAGALPALDVSDSHQALYAYTKTAHTQLTGTMIGAYDAWLAQKPDDVSAAIERCKFLQLSESARDDEELDDEASDHPAPGGAEECAEALSRRFPITPSVLLHERGEGVVRDLDLARELMGKACAGGFEGPACEQKASSSRR